MKFLKRIFGSDQSKMFYKHLPKISIKKLTLKLIFLGLIVFIITCIWIILYALFHGNINQQIENRLDFIIILPIINIILAFFAVYFFYSQKFVLKEQLQSLHIKDTLKHICILTLFLFLLAVIANTINFLMNPKDLINTFSYFSSVEIPMFGNEYFDIIFFILIWITTGLGEELLFRGGIYRSLRKSLNKTISIIISSLIFTFLHPSNLAGFIFIFILSVIYSLYFEYKNNILTIIILHFLQDLLFVGLANILAALLVKNIIGI